LEEFDNKQLPDVDLEHGLSTELTLPPGDDDTSADVMKPSSDQNEDSSLEDIEAKVFFSLCLD